MEMGERAVRFIQEIIRDAEAFANREPPIWDSG